jgi:cell division protein FtsL
VTRREVWFGLLLAGLVIVSAIGVTYAKSQSRRLFAERESLRAERDELAVEWRQLQLELATFAAHGRIESLARRELNMRVPAWGEIRIVQP